MLKTYRRLSIPKKLTLAGFSMLIPMIVLAAFMDADYRRDSRIGHMELAGTTILRDAYHIQHYLTNLHTLIAVQELPKSKSLSLDIEKRSPKEAVNEAIANIENNKSASLELSSHTAPIASTYACIDLSRVKTAWDWFHTTEQQVAYDVASEAALDLIHSTANCANLALDPALDSQMLARAAVDVLPESAMAMVNLQQLAISLMQATPKLSVSHLNPAQRDKLISTTAYFREGLLKKLLNDSQVALEEDANFHTYSPTLALNYGGTLSHYKKSANLLLEVAYRIEKGQASPSELFNAAARVKSAGHTLFNSAMDELDVLVQKRLDSLENWRIASASISLLGFLLSLGFLAATSRVITQNIEAVRQHTQQIADGNYNSTLDGSTLGPRLRKVVEDTNTLVETLKGKISHMNSLLDGMTVPFIMVDRDETITFISKAALQLASPSASVSHVIGKKLAHVLYRDVNTKTISGRSMETNTPIRNTLFDFQSRDGITRHVQFDVTPLTSPSGEVTGAFLVIFDLTEMMEKERSIERLAAFPKEAPNPMLSSAPDGSILYLNNAASSLFETADASADQNFLPDGHAGLVESCLATGADRRDIESTIGNKTFSWTYHPVMTQQVVHMYGSDITKRLQAETQILHDAFHDTLTGFPNKALFLDRVNQAFRRSRRRGTNFAVLFLDIDGFKNINDGLGHNVGDKLLARFAWRVKNLLGPDETLARLGGDEFTILLPTVSDNEHALQVANRIQGDLKRPFDLDGKDLFVSASIGVINAPQGAGGPADLLRDAETAMYRAKSLGRARAEMFNSAMQQDASERIQLETDLKRAVENREFEPYYQPIISLATGRITGFEALIRWMHPKQGMISPARFIPLAEETGLIDPIGAFMLEAACKQAKLWQQLPAHRNLTMSVNVSVAQINRATIGQEIGALLKQTGLPASTLKIEITESGLMNNVGHASTLLNDLETMGVSLMIDDFGTGYSSLSHLHQFPFNFLKIDRSFVSTMEDKPANMKIVSSIISLAHTLGKRVVGEGVETESQRQMLSNLGCEFVQGFYFSRPLPAAKAEALLEENPSWE